MKQTVKKMLKRAGYDLHRIEPPFSPFLRHFTFAGQPFDFWIGNSDAEWWYQEEGWKIAGEYKELARLCKSGDRVLEIGSHQGFTGILCAIFSQPGGSVVGLEAHPLNAMIATAQVGINPAIRNLRFINAAGGDKEGFVQIAAKHNSSVVPGGGEATVKVPLRTGDSLDKEFGPFNLLKVDVEGFENMVLKGCEAILRRRPKIAIEVHVDSLPKYGTSVGEVLERIHIKDYEGTMVIRPDYNTVKPFVLEQLPATGIANLFLTPK